MPALPVAPTDAARHGGRSVLQPIALTDYEISGGFWKTFQDLNRDSIIPHCINSLEQVGWIENFRAAVRGTLATDRVGRLFTDSEIYKVLEALAWENARKPSAALTQQIDELTEVVAQAQQPDGYLNTYYGYDGGPARYSDMEWGHELYCAGHLLQAAVAMTRTDGNAELIEVARRLADHVCEKFATDDRICGHPEIETALAELYRATGEQRYLDQAKAFVDWRGHRRLADTMYRGRDYYQDNVPVRDAEVLVGHAVRALYLIAGALDVAVETGDDELLAAVKRQYDATLERRTYLTGGMGSNHHGETYGDDRELPSERAYAETCAAVASIHVAWRLLLATGEARYGDVIERTLYNSVVSSPSVDGRSFFYVNALQRRTPGIPPEEGVPSLRRTDGTRASWYTTSCCPTNIARLGASLSAYLASVDESGVQLHQYATGSLDVSFGADRAARLSIQTEYPHDGVVRVRVDETDGDEWTLRLRVPAWTSGTIAVGGEEWTAGPGTAEVTRQWQPGDDVVLTLDVRPRFVFPDPRIDHLRGCVAVERGPLVYALESADQPDLDLELVAIDTQAAPRDADLDPALGAGVGVVAEGIALELEQDGVPYASRPPAVRGRPVELRLIPYYRWANRGASTMRVWAPRRELLDGQLEPAAERGTN